MDVVVMMVIIVMRVMVVGIMMGMMMVVAVAMMVMPDFDSQHILPKNGRKEVRTRRKPSTWDVAQLAECLASTREALEPATRTRLDGGWWAPVILALCR